MTSEKRAQEISDYFKIHGTAETQKHFNISHYTIVREVRRLKNKQDLQPNSNDKTALLKKIAEIYTESELQSIAAGNKILAAVTPPVKIDFSGTSFKFCFFTDSHIGSVYFHENLFESMLDECKKEGVEYFCHSGDVTDGMSNRPDHVYQLTHIGYDKQKEYAIKLLSQLDKPSCFISGNHDRWFIKSNGADIVKDVCAAIPGAEFLGHDVGTLEIKGSKIMLWHGEDASSYAVSYRIQKLIEALTGGTKPNVLLCGHTHKQGYFFERNIHAITGGALSLQSSWMRSKRLANHSGFWIIKLTFDTAGHVNKCQTTWTPFYQ